jgi:hypothetical protein
MTPAEKALSRINRTLLKLPKLADALHRADSVVARMDAEWKEEEHPRGEDGKFGSGGKINAAKNDQRIKDIKAKFSVHKAVKNKPFLEQHFHKTAETWEHAPQLVLDAVAGTKSVEKIWIDEKGPGSSYYMPGEHTITMGYGEPDPDNKQGVIVWRHEFAHAMDGNGSEKMESEKYINAMLYDVGEDRTGIIVWREKPGPEISLKERQRAKDADTRIVKEYMDLYTERKKASNDPYYDEHEGGSLHDFVCALTRNKHGWGHSIQYFSHKTNRVAEMFAQYVTLISGKDGEVYREGLHKIAPSACRGFDIILENRAGREWKKK